MKHNPFQNFKRCQEFLRVTLQGVTKANEFKKCSIVTAQNLSEKRPKNSVHRMDPEMTPRLQSIKKPSYAILREISFDQILVNKKESAT